MPIVGLPSILSGFRFLLGSEAADRATESRKRILTWGRLAKG
ncbi:hypothetical protein B2J93_6491 [Marssonina coronariae]|uniref:Uncharacterized protein n=1 Tax=Diplocarpon coronariae TaxID=2795749 RepID=A0A218Z3U4_9HELO|nr:hypothetical protein B2J93_6491 [Marssonina coronariae]